MRDPVKERATLAARHDFDSLPTDTDVEVRPAHCAELPILADMAHRLVPGVQMTAPVLERYFAFDAECGCGPRSCLNQGCHLGPFSFAFVFHVFIDEELVDDLFVFLVDHLPLHFQ